MSGTPDIFDVKTMLPLAKAANGRPEGARVTDRVSITSAYISFEVCRTFALLQGRAGVFVLLREDIEELAMFGLGLVWLRVVRYFPLIGAIALTLAS